MKKKILLSSILTIALCLSLFTGATYALFTSEDKVDIAITSGKVEAVATIENLETWSLEDDKAAAGRTDGTFSQGGKVEVVDNKLTLKNVIPGDKVRFDVKIENKSNVAILYSFAWETKEDGLVLMGGMNVTINGVNYGPLKEYNSAWTALAAEAVVNPIKVELELPEEAGNEYQGLETGATITVQCVQGNAGYTDTESFSKIEAAASAPVVAGEATNIALSDGTSATIPADAVLEAGATNATLIIASEDADAGNFAFANGSEQKGLNISIPEVAETNDKPIVITLPGELASGLNSTTVFMFHKGVQMTRVDAAADVDADGEFFYDATNGNIVFATTNFSNFTIVTLKQTEVASEAEFVAAVTKGENVILTENITISKTVIFRNNVHIDLNGYAISAGCTNSTLFQVASDQKPNVVITSSKEGAELNVFGNGLVLNYGSLEFSNVEINVTDIRSTNYQTFNTYGDIKLGKDVVVNVEYLGTSIISAQGACKIVIDGATINVGTFKIHGGALIDLADATELVMENATVEMTGYVVSQFGGPHFIDEYENVTVNNCSFNIADESGTVYKVVPSAEKQQYRIEK